MENYLLLGIVVYWLVKIHVC